MGGRALKNKDTITRRYERDEFDKLVKKMSDILGRTFKLFEIPRFYHNKESFGDMDIIISMDGFNRDMRDYIEKTFKPNEIFHNGNAWSFDYKELQIDFITCKGSDFDSNYHYLSFNDLGNFMGRIAQKLGLKYGQEGLWYNHYHNNQKIGKIMISKDYPKIFKFFGLDYNKWLTGFDSLEDIFEYVINSPYFDSNMYNMEDSNRINRERNLKRASYVKFLDYIQNNASDIEHTPIELDLVGIHNIFPESNILQEIKRLEYVDALMVYATSKFNGHIAMEKYGISGRELGDCMRHFRSNIEEDFGDYHEALVMLDEDEIFAFFEASNTII